MKRPLTRSRFIAGLFGVVLATVGVAATLALSGGDSSHQSPPSIVSGSEPQDEPLVAADHNHDTPEFQTIRAVGFENAPEALGAAVDFAPFPLTVPAYVPAGVSLWHVDTTIDTRTGAGSTELYYAEERAAGEGPLEAFRISWSNVPEDREALEPDLAEVVERGEFQASGREWGYFLLRWRDYDMYQARTLGSDGIVISADIRVISMDHGQALSELQKSLGGLDSPNPQP